MKINWTKVCIVGLKVVLAVGTGLAVLAGVSQATKSFNKGNNSDNATTGNHDTGAGFTAPTVPGSNSNGSRAAQAPAVAPKIDKAEMVSNGLKATQGSLEKVIAVIGSLAVAVESIGSLFTHKIPDRPYYREPWSYSSGCGGYWQPASQEGQFYGNRQINPFIQEVGRVPGFRERFGNNG